MNFFLTPIVGVTLAVSAFMPAPAYPVKTGLHGGRTELLRVQTAQLRKTQDDGKEEPKTLSAKELMARGDGFNAKGDLDRAVADYDAALKIDPAFTEALDARAMAWRAKGDRRKALTDFDAALRLKPDFEIARANRKILFQEIERAGAQMPLKPK